MTGKRSSSMASANPTDNQKSGVAALVASGSRADRRVGLDGGEAALGQVVADRRRPSARASPAPRASAVVAMQVMTAGNGESGSAGYRSRVRCARGYAVNGPNCAYAAGTSSPSRTLAYDPATPSPRPSSWSFGARPTRRSALRRPRREGIVERAVVVFARRQERVDGRAVANGLATGAFASRSARNGLAGRGLVAAPGASRAGGLEPAEPGRLRAVVGVLPVVARPMIEPGIGARRQEAEPRASVTSTILIRSWPGV